MKSNIKRIFACLVTLSLAIALLVCAPANVPVVHAEEEPVNLVANGDFEARSTIPGWDLGTNVKVNLAHGDAKTGELALRMEDDSASAGCEVSSVKLPIQSGRDYAASVYVKGAAGAQLTIRFCDASGAVIDSAVAATTAETTDWTKLSANKVSPAGAVKADVLLSTTDACVGTVLFDDALLDQASEPVDLVTNGTFENGLTPWTQGYGGTVSIVDKSATDTSKVLKVDSVYGSYTTIKQIRMPAIANQAYVFNMDYKLALTRKTSNSVMARLQFMDANNSVIGSDIDIYMEKVAEKDWTHFSKEVTAPVGTVRVDLMIWVWSDNEGEVWLDNIHLTEKALDSLSNTSFEEVAAVPNWTISGSGEKHMAVDGGNPQAGNGAFYIKDNSSTAVNVKSDYVQLSDNQIGHEIKLSYNVYGLGPKGSDGMVNATTPSVFIAFFGADGRELATSTRIIQSGAYDHWTQRSKTGVVPEGAKSFLVWIGYGTSSMGDVLIDNVSVTLVCKHDTLTYQETTPATCKGPGVESAFCTLCQKTITRPLAQKDHEWDEGTIKTPASCDETGVKVYECTICHDKDELDYPATGHTLTAVSAKPATETENGNIAYWTCDCGKWFADAEENDEIYDKLTVIIPSTNGMPNDGQTTTPTKPATPVTPVDPNKEPPKVSDNTALVLMLAIMAVSGLVLIATKSKFSIR